MRTYHPPVADLLNYAKVESTLIEDWPDYVTEFGLTADHIPELLTLMQDQDLLEPDSEVENLGLPAGIDPILAVWAPAHAWRALGQLQAVEFVEGAVALINSVDDPLTLEEFPQVCQLIGPPVLEPLATALQQQCDRHGKMAALVHCVEAFGNAFPAERDRCVAVLTTCLSQFEQNTVENNTQLVIGLLELQATEPAAIAVLEAAFQAHRIKEFYTGTWASVQVELGLKTAADFTPAELIAEMPPELQQLRSLYEDMERIKKPDAFSLGLPLDPAQLPSTKPPGFEDMLMGRSLTNTTQKGFGPSSKTAKKGKKKKR